MSDRQLSGVNSHKENGSGKSTLIKAILGLKPQISGQIEWGKDIKKNETGYLPQVMTRAPFRRLSMRMILMNW